VVQEAVFDQSQAPVRSRPPISPGWASYMPTGDAKALLETGVSQRLPGVKA
jgi:hypothetical protein